MSVLLLVQGPGTRAAGSGAVAQAAAAAGHLGRRNDDTSNTQPQDFSGRRTH